jgi:ubiquinol-cytochrome c reductase iron-sulfur subunit
MYATQTISGASGDLSPKRRDFLFVATGVIATVGTALAAWPLVDSLNPDAATLSFSAVDVDLKPIAEGQRITVKWRGSPVFIVHRTPAEISRAQADDGYSGLIDPAPDSTRVKSAEWLIIVGVCTHLGCIPLGQMAQDPRSEFGGWFCPCHGSKYDTSGRVRRGPAPRNLEVPSYEFIRPDFVRIG